MAFCSSVVGLSLLGLLGIDILLLVLLRIQVEEGRFHEPNCFERTMNLLSHSLLIGSTNIRAVIVSVNQLIVKVEDIFS